MDKILQILRAILGDLDSSTYTDDRLNKIITIAAFQVYNSASFSTSYSFNLTNDTITPDPSDDSFIILSAYKSACLIATYELKNDSGGFSISDGPTSINMSGSTQNKKEISKSYCEIYEQLLLDYLVHGGISGDGGPGQAILGPYSPGSDFIGERGGRWQ